GRAAAMDRGRRLRIPAMAFKAHVLNAHRLAGELRHHRCVHGDVTGIVASVGAGAGHPDCPYLLDGNAETPGDALSGEMRLLRARPHRDTVRTHVGDSAARA